MFQHGGGSHKSIVALPALWGRRCACVPAAADGSRETEVLCATRDGGGLDDGRAGPDMLMHWKPGQRSSSRCLKIWFTGTGEQARISQAEHTLRAFLDPSRFW
jgi:hypothetical protein